MLTFIFNFLCKDLSAILSGFAGEDKEEEAEGERRDKKQRNVKGNSKYIIPGARIRTSLMTRVHYAQFSLVCFQMPDPSQVTAMATQPSVAVRLTIYFRPGDSIKSLLRSSINTASATRDSIGWDVC